MQSINFTLFAPSGSGGAIISEILDNNYSREGDIVTHNYRNTKTNEYAGSPNCYNYTKFDAHFIMNEFPDWNENTILYGKYESPLKFYENCDIVCPKLYYVDVTGHEEYIRELAFMKKSVGGHMFAEGVGRVFESVASKNFDYKSKTSILRDRDALTLFENKLQKISAEYDGFLHIHSPIVLNVLSANQLDPSRISKHEIHQEMLSTYKRMFESPFGGWKNVDEVKDHTDIHIIKYDDLLNGRDTDTKLDDHKSELKDYFERNSEILDKLLSLLNL